MKDTDNDLLQMGVDYAQHSAISVNYDDDQTLAEIHRKYLEKQKNREPVKHIAKSNNLFLETVNTVFDKEGNVLAKNGTVRNLGPAEFIPGKKLVVESIQPVYEQNNLADKPVPNFEERILAEIESHEKKQKEDGVFKPGVYYYKGKQVYPKIESGENDAVKAEVQKKTVSFKLVDKSSIDKKFNETIAKQIVMDLDLLQKLELVEKS